jgi:threonine synthase
MLDVVFTPAFDPAAVSGRKPTLWRYREALPVADDASIVSFDEGLTPLVPVDFGGVSVLVKQDQLFSTGSYKDRGATVLVSHLKALGVQRIVEDSSGNAGCAIAAYCARAGIACTIYVPADTSPAKLSQLREYGATLAKVPGSRDDTARAVLRAAEDTYYASHSWNPFFFQGTKTIAYEVCEQLGWRAPDSMVLPVGNGTLLLGAYIGFSELLQAGVISRLPKLIGVQAAACAPLYTAFQERREAHSPVMPGHTAAEGIAITDPIRGRQILQAVRDTGGCFVAVTEPEITASLTNMGRQGFYIEPTSAATTAGVSKYLASLAEQELVVSVFTGHGLKTTGSMRL